MKDFRWRRSWRWKRRALEDEVRWSEISQEKFKGKSQKLEQGGRKPGVDGNNRRKTDKDNREMWMERSEGR